MKFIKKRNQYEASNVSFDPENISAVSYNWWEFVKVINGKVVFNDYNYSPSTCKHQIKVRRLLETLNIKVDVVIECPCGLQKEEWMESSLGLLQSKINIISNQLNNPKRKKALDEKRKESIAYLEEKKLEVLRISKSLLEAELCLS